MSVQAFHGYDSTLAGTRYFLRVFGITAGPYKAADILDAYSAGKISSETLAVVTSSKSPPSDLRSWAPVRAILPAVLQLSPVAASSSASFPCAQCSKSIDLGLPMLIEEMLCPHCSTKLRVECDSEGGARATIMASSRTPSSTGDVPPSPDPLFRAMRL